MVDWTVSYFKAFRTEYLRKECSDLNEVASDNDDDKNDDDDDDNDDDDDTNSKDIEVIVIGTAEPITMPERLINLKDLSNEERSSLVAMQDILEKIRVLNKSRVM